MGIIVISDDVPELLEVCHRVSSSDGADRGGADRRPELCEATILQELAA